MDNGSRIRSRRSASLPVLTLGGGASLATLLLATSCTALLGDDFVVDPAGAAAAGGAGTGGTGTGAASTGGGGAATCAPATTSCVDGATLSICDDTGHLTTEPCPADAPACVNGACAPCTAGEVACVDATVSECADGQWSVVEACELGCREATCVEVVGLSAGAASSCARLSDGTVRCWGYNKLDLLFIDGLDDPPEPGSFTTTPLPVPDLNDALAIGSGDAHSCALRPGGEVWCWGWNGIGQLGVGTYASSSTPLQVPLDAAAVDLSVGLAHSCAALATGLLWCWGLNESGQLGNGESGSSLSSPSPVSLSLGVPIGNAAAGRGHTCVRTTTSEAACWGANYSGEVGDGTTVSTVLMPAGVGGEGVLQIAVGGSHSCARFADHLNCWGRNASGELGTGVAGPDERSPVAAAMVGTIRSVALGGRHSCAITDEEDLICWGDDEFGQVGDARSGAGVLTLAPYVLPLGPVTAVALGELHTCALTAAGEVYCWGLGNRGQLGDGGTDSATQPVKVVW